jgi:hypothetical protein
MVLGQGQKATLVIVFLLAESQGGIARNREHVWMCASSGLSLLQSHWDLIMGFFLISNPNHLAKALPLNIIAGAGLHSLNASQW